MLLKNSFLNFRMVTKMGGKTLINSVCFVHAWPKQKRVNFCDAIPYSYTYNMYNKLITCLAGFFYRVERGLIINKE